jgi:hypothetical protein
MLAEQQSRVAGPFAGMLAEQQSRVAGPFAAFGVGYPGFFTALASAPRDSILSAADLGLYLGLVDTGLPDLKDVVAFDEGPDGAFPVTLCANIVFLAVFMLLFGWHLSEANRQGIDLMAADREGEFEHLAFFLATSLAARTGTVRILGE